MKGSRVALWLLGCAWLAAGCQLLAGIEDLSLADAGEGGPVPEGGYDSSGSGSSGGSGSSSSSGASGGDDSSGGEPGDAAEAGADVTPGDGEAGNSGDAQSCGTGFCASFCRPPTFCDDFDEHGLGLWTVTATGGTIAEDTISYVSPPRSLFAQDDALTSGLLDDAARATFVLMPAPSTFILQFQFEPVSTDLTPSAATVVASLDFTDAPGNRYTVQLTLAQPLTPSSSTVGMRFEEQAGLTDGGTFYVSHPLPDTVPVGSWTPMTLVIHRTAAFAAAAKVYFGSNQEGSVSLQMDVDATMLQLTIGSAYESYPSKGWKNRYDDVLLDIQ